jgi:predicted nucleic acid-binding protein
MKTVIADTSALVSLVSINDSNHSIAVKWAKKSQENIYLIIPGEVHTEFMNIFGKKAGHQEAIKKGTLLLESPDFQVVETNRAIRVRAYEIYKQQKQDVSFTDCIVMAFADSFKTKEIFGFDKAFAVNKYNILS